MSKAFFSHIGQELYSIKNSPFHRLSGQLPGEKPLRQSQSLAYNPDRLFNPDKHRKEEEQAEPDFIEFKKKQKEQLSKIQYDLLKKNTNEDYQQKVSKMEAMRRQDHRHPYSWFGVYRGMCSSCDKCGEYEGYFNHTHEEIQLMECTKCLCPMNSHVVITGKNPFRDTIWKHLKKYQIKDDYLKVDYMLMGFKARGENVHEYGTIIDILSQFSCNVVDAKIINKLKFQLGLVKSVVISQGVQKGYLQSILNLIECLQSEEEWKWNSGKLAISEYYEELYEMIKKTVHNLKIQIDDEEQIVMMLVKCPKQIQNHVKRVARDLKEAFKVFQLCWGSSSNKQSLISCQIFFKEYFSVKYQIFLLPGSREQTEWNNLRFKDVLDYNRFILLMENLKNVDRNLFEKTFRQFNTNKLNYILGEQILSEKIKRVGFKLTAKIGPSKMVLPFNNVPDFVNVSQSNYIARALKNLYPEYCYSQRCAIVVRPFAVTSNFEEVIVNLLRINNFILIKRLKVKLDQSQARYLATLQNIDQNKLEEYIEFMTTGVCEIVLVSKRSAIYEAYALTMGCETGPTDIRTKTLREKPTLQVKKGKDMYEYQIPFNVESSLRNSDIFSGLSSSISIEKILFGGYSPVTFATKSSTGEIVKVEGENLEAQTLKISNKMRESLLKELKSDLFNYWAFSSKSETITEEIVGIFLPECTLFEPITLIIKPGFTHLTPLIKNALIQHKYHIIRDKEIQMSKLLAAELILNLQKIKLPKEQLRYIIDCYTNQRIHILCVSKISGRKEIVSMLKDFNFVSKKNYDVEEIIEDEMLCDMLVPVWNNEEMCLKILSQPLGNLEESIKQLDTNDLTKQEKFQVFNYLVGSFFGVSIQDLSLNTKIGKLSYYITDEFSPKLQSWYYSLLSNRFPNYVPLLFQYRILGQTPLCIQSDHGNPFIEMIIQLYEKEMQKMQETNQKNRKSLVLFLWTKKLVEFAIDLSQITTELKDFGQIQFKNTQYRGHLSQEEAILRQEKFLQEASKEFQIHRQIKKNIKKLQGSRSLRERYINSNKRLLPSITADTLDQNLRIVEKSEASKLHLMNKFSLIDPNNEQEGAKDMYNLTIYNTVPEIKTKYSFIVEIFYFLIKGEFENPHQSQIYSEMLKMYSDYLTEIRDLQVVEYEIYLKYLIEYFKAEEGSEVKNWIFILLKVFPNLKKGKQIIQNNEVSGKKRKYLDHKQYFVRKKEINEEAQQIIQKQYTQFDLNKIADKFQANNLYNPNDPLHQRIAKNENKVNLLREDPINVKRGGMYVEFEKKISQNQEVLRTKLKNQVDRFNLHKNDQILHQTGLQKDLWYRRTKGEVKESKQTKTNIAIQKQIGKFMQFKEDEKRRISQKQI